MSLRQINVNNSIITKIDKKPTPLSENLVESGGSLFYTHNFTLVGDTTRDAVWQEFYLIPGRKYIVNIERSWTYKAGYACFMFQCRDEQTLTMLYAIYGNWDNTGQYFPKNITVLAEEHECYRIAIRIEDNASINFQIYDYEEFLALNEKINFGFKNIVLKEENYLKGYGFNNSGESYQNGTRSIYNEFIEVNTDKIFLCNKTVECNIACYDSNHTYLGYIPNTPNSDWFAPGQRMTFLKENTKYIKLAFGANIDF